MFLPGESQGRGSLVGCRLWGRTELDTTEVTQQQYTNELLEQLLASSLAITQVHTAAMKLKDTYSLEWKLWPT